MADTYSFDVVKERAKNVNEVSPTFCLAKWLQSTIYLYRGQTHSCHHPAPHQINPDDLKGNPCGIHNTPVKIQARREMLAGVQTKECDYCWRIENLKNGWTSDRIYKSTYSWSYPHLQEVVASGDGATINPTYLEVAFENTCNFKCVYCSPECSSRWDEEIKGAGPIKLTTRKHHDPDYYRANGKVLIDRDSPNPYTDAFWEWWPHVYPTLKVFRITGGEPLLSAHTWRVLEYIHDNPNPNLQLAINTNMGVPQRHIDKLVTTINRLEGKIKGFEIYTSLESTGKQAEFARFGLNYQKFLENCRHYLDSTPNEWRLNFMTTINLLSASTFLDFLKLIASLREEYVFDNHDFRVRTIFSYLRWPEFLSLTLLPQELKTKYAQEWQEYVSARTIDWKDPKGVFYPEEKDQIDRLVDYMLSTPADTTQYGDLKLFIEQMENRRNVSFKETFPELQHLL
jgi:organic radical activating enzyme